MSPSGQHMYAEIHQQPGVFEALLKQQDELREVRREIGRFSPRHILFAGRGTSGHAGLYGQYLSETRLNVPAGRVTPSTLTVYRARPRLDGVLLIAVSQSGGSPDLVEATAAARDLGAMTVAVTNASGSLLADAAQFHVDVQAGAEQAVAATKTYTAELLALYLLLQGENGGGEDAAALPEAAERTLDHEDHVETAAGKLRFAQRIVLTARGYSLATAAEAALKLMETSYLSAQAFSAAELLHGPVAVVGPEVPVIAISTPGAGGRAAQPVLDRLRAAGADVLPVGPPDGLPVVTDGLPEALHPLVEILPLQVLAWSLARRRGEDPDAPRGLSKVTRTW